MGPRPAQPRRWPPRAPRSGAPVEAHRFPGTGAAVAFLAEALRPLFAREPRATVAVLTRHPEEADRYYEGLRRAEVPLLRRVRAQEFSFRPGDRGHRDPPGQGPGVRLRRPVRGQRRQLRHRRRVPPPAPHRRHPRRPPALAPGHRRPQPPAPRRPCSPEPPGSPAARPALPASHHAEEATPRERRRAPPPSRPRAPPSATPPTPLSRRRPVRADTAVPGKRPPPASALPLHTRTETVVGAVPPLPKRAKGEERVRRFQRTRRMRWSRCP